MTVNLDFSLGIMNSIDLDKCMWASLVAQTIESAYNAGDQGSVPGPGRSPGEGNGNTLQYSSLEKPMDLRGLVAYSL